MDALPEEQQVLAREAYAIGLHRVFIVTACAAFLGYCIRLGVCTTGPHACQIEIDDILFQIPELPLDRTEDEDAATAASAPAPIAISAARPDPELDRGLHDVDNSDDDGWGDDDGDSTTSINLALPRPKVRRLSTYESDDGFDPEIVGSRPTSPARKKK